MTGRLVDMAFTLNGKQRVTLEINGDFREIWDRLHQEPVLDVEIKKHREKRSLSANAYFHVLCNKISAETGESEDAVKRRLVVSYGALARDKDGKPVGLKLPPTVDPSDFYPYVRLYETRQENGKDYSCYFVYKESHKMDSKEFAHLVDGAIEEAKELGIQTDTPGTAGSLQRRMVEMTGKDNHDGNGYYSSGTVSGISSDAAGTAPDLHQEQRGDGL